MKRTFGLVEAVFDIAYLATGATIGIVLATTAGHSVPRMLAGIMALTLAGGDAFHLVPRVRSILSAEPARLRAALGRGKQVTSITMTIFYLLLWAIGCLLAPLAGDVAWTVALVALAVVRVALCLAPQNGWTDEHPSARWGIIRNVPFAAMGVVVAVHFLLTADSVPAMSLAWLAIVISFVCYLPVVAWADEHPPIGALMLPKTCAYVWLLVMCLGL
ncbi:MAG: hypothetical protein WAY93_09725 [Atopobiaceae bacterium]|jgi:hypothetical protein|nr:hypothetical protein [Atopobiaceae bacterium]